MALTATAEQSNSKRGLIIGIVIAMHAAGIYIVESGLSRSIIELVAPPVETKIIEEQKPPEELPPPPPPPDMPVNPPPFIPPPEVAIQIQQQTTAIQAVTNEQPPAVVPPIMAAAPPAPAVPGTKPKLDGKKSRSPDEYYPAASNRADETGSVVVRCFVKTDGRCSDASVTQSSSYERLDQAAVKYANEGIRFTPGTNNGAAEAMWYEFKVTFKQKTAR